jgi:Spy/CpxP family protein refolding chaperone
MKTNPYWKVIGWIVAVVLCSGSIGAAVALRVQNQRMARAAASSGMADVRLDRLTEMLNLTEQQQTEIRLILERGQGEIRAIAAAAATEAAQVSRRLDEDIRPLLDADQLRRFERLSEVRQRVRERWKTGERLTPEQREWLRERVEQRYGTRPWGEGRRP